MSDDHGGTFVSTGRKDLSQCPTTIKINWGWMMEHQGSISRRFWNDLRYPWDTNKREGFTYIRQQRSQSSSLCYACLCHPILVHGSKIYNIIHGHHSTLSSHPQASFLSLVRSHLVSAASSTLGMLPSPCSSCSVIGALLRRDRGFLLLEPFRK